MEYKISDNTRCGVIGYGTWATALVHTLELNNKEIWWHIRNEEVLEGLLTEGRNVKYLSDVDFDTKFIHATQDINEVVRNCEIILVAAPSAYLKIFMADLTESLEGKFILSATKGIIPDEYITITEYFNQTYGLPYSNLGVISGPSHAEEVSCDRLSYLTVACKDIDNAHFIGGIGQIACVHPNLHQITAAVKGTNRNICHTGGDDNTGQTGAIGKCRIANGCHGIAIDNSRDL
jgi:glycerol-3-phosphate dehydrogenase (NAD(P)+)